MLHQWHFQNATTEKLEWLLSTVGKEAHVVVLSLSSEKQKA